MTVGFVSKSRGGRQTPTWVKRTMAIYTWHITYYIIQLAHIVIYL